MSAGGKGAIIACILAIFALTGWKPWGGHDHPKPVALKIAELPCGFTLPQRCWMPKT
jgi:hypothetical protein